MNRAGSGAERPLVDGQGRLITYLRLSLTDLCNFRCSYCAPAALGRRGRHSPPLTRDEIRCLVSIFARLGVRRIRLTGGEPTLRRDLPAIVSDLARLSGIEEVALTTNGHLLEEQAHALRACGVAQLNVSFDTLNPVTLRRLSGPAADLARLKRGIASAARAGFASLKLNTVVVRDENQGELGDLARFAWRHGAIARFIELMPFGAGAPVPVAEMLQLLASQGIRLEDDSSRGWGPARHMRGAGEDHGQPVCGLLGFIGALTENFCEGCNRVRVGADGRLRACLGGREEVPLAELIRSGASDDAIADGIRQALARKDERHAMGTSRLLPMIGLGG